MDEPIATVVAALIAAAASIVAALLARRSSNAAEAVERDMRIRQARLDERDLILAAGGFVLPVESDAMWRDYERLVTGHVERGRDAGAARKEASEQVRQQAPLTPNRLVGHALSS